MSLADIIPMILETRIERRVSTATERQMRWVRKNRNKFNAYRRAWRARRKANG